MSPMTMMLILLAVLLFILTVVIIYRNTLEMHEDDQLFLDEAESYMAKEQEELQRKMRTLDPMVKIIGAVSALLLLAIVGLWIYQGLNRPIT